MCVCVRDMFLYINDRRFNERSQYNHRNSPNVRCFVCSICSIPGHYEQHCHIVMCQFQDLATLSGVNMPQPLITNTHTIQIQQLAIEQDDDNKQDS